MIVPTLYLKKGKTKLMLSQWKSGKHFRNKTIEIFVNIKTIKEKLEKYVGTNLKVNMIKRNRENVQLVTQIPGILTSYSSRAFQRQHRVWVFPK